MTYTVTGPEAVDPGTYRGRCVAIEEMEHPQFGQRIRWTFALEEADNHTVSRFTSTSFSEKSKASETVAALFGRKLDRGESFTKDDLIGRSCSLLLSVGASGWNVVEKALPMTRKPATRPVAPREYDDSDD